MGEPDVVSVADSEFEGRYFWVDENVGRERFRTHKKLIVRLPPPFAERPIEVSLPVWQQAFLMKKPHARRRLRTPLSFLQSVVLADDSTTLSSSSSRGFSAPPPPRTQSPLFIYPDGDGLEHWLANAPARDVSVDELREALRDYARLLADTRWFRMPVLWKRLHAAYPRLLGDDGNLRVHVLVFVLRFLAAPYPWLRREGGTITTGISEHYPPFLVALFNAEKTIVAAQCRSEAASADGALACLRVAQQYQAQSLGTPRLTESSKGSRPVFSLDLETGLLGGFGACASELDAAALCRQLLPKLHVRALKADLMRWMRAIAKQLPPGSVTIDPAKFSSRIMAYYWSLAQEARPFIADALLLPDPADFFLGRSVLGPSAFPERVQQLSLSAAGHWKAPRSREERHTRFAALHVDMEDLFKAAPPCMAAALNRARTERHLKNDDRYPLSTWFAELFPRTAANDVARALFGGDLTGAESETKIVRTIADAQKKPWAPYSCHNILSRHVQSDETTIVCPYAERAVTAQQTCIACYVSEKKLAAEPAALSLETPVDYVLLYKGR